MGKRYGTKASAFQYILQGPDPIRHPTTGDIIGNKKEIIAEAAVHRGEVNAQSPDGGTIRISQISGHLIDTGQQAEEKGWTEEEQQRVEAALDFECDRQPAQIWHIEDPVFAAPWPSYDDTHHNQVPVIAQQTGLVAEAIQYERQNKNRETVLGKLEERLAEQESAVEAEQALTVA